MGCSNSPEQVQVLENFFPDSTTATTTQPERDLGCGTLCSHTSSGPEPIVGSSYWTGKCVIDLGSGTGVSAGVLGCND